MTKMEREMLIMANMPLVYYIAKKTCQNPQDMLDLVSEGTLGLIKAVDGKDPKYTQKQFQDYMQRCIQGSMYSKFRKDADIRRVEAGFIEDLVYEIPEKSTDFPERDFEDMIKSLSEDEKEIIRGVILYGMYFEDIAKKLKITRQGVMYKYEKILKKLKKEI